MSSKTCEPPGKLSNITFSFLELLAKLPNNLPSLAEKDERIFCKKLHGINHMVKT
jgi:hypothetical protein